MSVSLCVDWPDGRFEEFPLATQEMALNEVATLAAELNLNFYRGIYPFSVTPRVIDQLIDETRLLFAGLLATVYGGVHREYGESKFEAYLGALHRLKECHGWSASVG